MRAKYDGSLSANLQTKKLIFKIKNATKSTLSKLDVQNPMRQEKRNSIASVLSENMVMKSKREVIK